MLLASSLCFHYNSDYSPTSRLSLRSPLFRPLVNNLNSGNSLPELEPPNHPLHPQYPASNVCRMPRRRLRTQTWMSGNIRWGVNKEREAALGIGRDLREFLLHNIPAAIFLDILSLKTACTLHKDRRKTIDNDLTCSLYSYSFIRHKLSRHRYRQEIKVWQWAITGIRNATYLWSIFPQLWGCM